jgi:phage-related holin
MEYVLKFIFFLGVFLTPIYYSMLAVGALIFFDTLLGILAAKQNGEKIHSRKLSRVLTKSLAYQSLIICAHICQTFLVPNLFFVDLTLSFIAIVEFKSIGENFSKITGKNFIVYIKEYLERKLLELTNKK